MTAWAEQGDDKCSSNYFVFPPLILHTTSYYVVLTNYAVIFFYMASYMFIL